MTVAILVFSGNPVREITLLLVFICQKDTMYVSPICINYYIVNVTLDVYYPITGRVN